jgi:hypothetical protein
MNQHNALNEMKINIIQEPLLTLQTFKIISRWIQMQVGMPREKILCKEEGMYAIILKYLMG